MEELLKRHISETDRRFEEVLSQIESVHSKLEDLNDFKIQTIMSTRWVSGIISALSGLLTLVVSSVITYLTSKR